MPELPSRFCHLIQFAWIGREKRLGSSGTSPCLRVSVVFPASALRRAAHAAAASFSRTRLTKASEALTPSGSLSRVPSYSTPTNPR